MAGLADPTHEITSGPGTDTRAERGPACDHRCGPTYELREVVYADADGDALAPLFIMVGNETATQYYAWEWDEQCACRCRWVRFDGQ
ncbi:hypothetical protein [Occultella kanbiaonis]|uniref:hypothetical protein n=1 Tax=Occultella kanbiaonis TaxID=2675754 RepID=UPI0012B84D73|nr:hypothetical protein [Occultella kanbiaonis]